MSKTVKTRSTMERKTKTDYLCPSHTANGGLFAAWVGLDEAIITRIAGVSVFGTSEDMVYWTMGTRCYLWVYKYVIYHIVHHSAFAKNLVAL